MSDLHVPDSQTVPAPDDAQRRAGILVDAFNDEWRASAIRDMLGLPQAVVRTW